MSRRILAVAIVCYLLFSFFLITHQSKNGAVFSRYSIGYFVFLLFYFSGLILLIIAFFNTNRIHGALQQTNQRLTQSDISANQFVDKYFYILLLVIFVWFALGVFFLFPPQSIFSNQPILQVDYAHHYHQVSSVVATLTEYGKHWAYDPSFAAGYPLGTIFDVDMKLIEVFSFGLSRLGVNLPLAYNSLILAHFLAVPLILFVACKNFRCSRFSTFLIVLSGSLLWLSDDMIVEFNISGMVSFVFGVYWMILCTSLFHRFLTTEKPSSFFFFLIVFSLSFLIHILVPILLAVPLGVLYILHIKRIKLLSHILILLSCLLVLVVNSWWIATVIRFLPYRGETDFWETLSISGFVRSLPQMGSNLVDILIIFGLWGFFTFISKNKELSIVGLCSLIWFFFVGKLGSNFPLIRILEPQRFLIPATVIAMMGLMLGIQEPLSRIKFQPMKMRFQQVNWRIWFPIFLLPLIISITFFVPPWFKEDGCFCEPGVIDELMPIADWANEHTTKDARIAFLDMSPGPFTGAKMRYFVDREFIGGPFSALNLKHNYANFIEETFFEQEISTLTRDEFVHYGNLYNINWLISSEEATSLKIASFAPDVQQVAQFEAGENTFTIFEVNREPDYFLEGSGTVSAELNKIVVENASPGEIILKYHWLDTLAIVPDLPIEKYEIEGSPIDFIKVINGDTEDFVIYNSYDSNSNNQQIKFDEIGAYGDLFNLSYGAGR